ncbi:hypothetical protein CEXT_546631 [Caerostris extrusa]|uniref:Uncharacterized protein n=1 Tax=Caerostris extrusa TaxID=172846 RepID=A0AAV4Y1Q4_CAEEX|nr:hypothetical protein CEXT_546631 [Caerostris extrusa]
MMPMRDFWLVQDVNDAGEVRTRRPMSVRTEFVMNLLVITGCVFLFIAFIFKPKIYRTRRHLSHDSIQSLSSVENAYIENLPEPSQVTTTARRTTSAPMLLEPIRTESNNS